MSGRNTACGKVFRVDRMPARIRSTKDELRKRRSAANLVPAKLPVVHKMNANDVSIVSPLSALHLYRRKGVEVLGANST
jgi:hypothetical protein